MLPPSPFFLASLPFNDAQAANASLANVSLANTSKPLIGYTGTNSSFAVYYSLEYQLSGVMNAMAYGAVALLFANIAHSLFATWSQSIRTRLPYETILFVLSLFGLNTIYLTTSLLCLESTYIYNVDSPSGIVGFTLELLPTPAGILNQVSFSLGSILADTFLLGRTRVIFKAARSRRAYLYLAPAVILFLSSIVLAVIQALDEILPRGLFSNAQINWSTNYSVASLALNLYLTLGIALKIGTHKRRNGALQKGSTLYSHLFTIFIESAVLYSVVALGVVITYDSSSNMVWTSIWLPVQTIASFLITYRIARDLSWERETSVVSSQRDDPEVFHICSSTLTSGPERCASEHRHDGVHVFTLNPSTCSYSEEKC